MATLVSVLCLYPNQITQQWSLFKTVLQGLKSDLVSVSRAACFILSHRIQWSKERLWGGGVIPIKTWLQSVLNERKNLLADRPFQSGHLEVLEHTRRPGQLNICTIVLSLDIFYELCSDAMVMKGCKSSVSFIDFTWHKGES